MKTLRYNHFLMLSLTCVFILAIDARAMEGTISSEEKVRNAVEDYYIKGLKTRDFSLITSICIPEARLYGVRSDKSLSETTLQAWSKRFDPEHPPFKTLSANIIKTDVQGTAAQVVIRFVMDGREIHDFLNLLKVEGRWRIINIIDYATPQ
jgi:hypothetical protein